jgi:hypothetical protein
MVPPCKLFIKTENGCQAACCTVCKKRSYKIIEVRENLAFDMSVLLNYSGSLVKFITWSGNIPILLL